MGGQYRIAFRGEVADGHSVEDVQQQFADRFRKDRAAIERLFSGKVVTIARDLDWEKANSAVSKLQSFGAVVYLVDGKFFFDGIIEELRPAGVTASTPSWRKAAAPFSRH